MRHMLEFIGGEGARFYRTQNVFCGSASLFGLCFHRYTSLFHAGKKTKRQPSSKKAKQEETQTNKMYPLQSERSEQQQAAPRRK